jgi:hypothetical protein
VPWSMGGEAGRSSDFLSWFFLGHGTWNKALAVRMELVKRSKGARRMPRRGQARKDVASCDKPGGAARGL